MRMPLHANDTKYDLVDDVSLGERLDPALLDAPEESPWVWVRRRTKNPNVALWFRCLAEEAPRDALAFRRDGEAPGPASEQSPTPPVLQSLTVASDHESAEALVEYIAALEGDADWLQFALYDYTMKHRNDAVTAAVTALTRSAIENAATLAVAELARHPGPTLSKIVGELAPGSGTATRNLSEPEFAKLMGVSSRTIAYDRAHMTQGVHFHFHGRRVLYHVPEAEDFIRTHRGSLSRGADDERLAIDEVTKRRARVALRKTAGGGR